MENTAGKIENTIVGPRTAELDRAPAGQQVFAGKRNGEKINGMKKEKKTLLEAHIFCCSFR